jgi:hypothetical protein
VCELFRHTPRIYPRTRKCTAHSNTDSLPRTRTRMRTHTHTHTHKLTHVHVHAHAYTHRHAHTAMNTSTTSISQRITSHPLSSPIPCPSLASQCLTSGSLQGGHLWGCWVVRPATLAAACAICERQRLVHETACKPTPHQRVAITVCKRNG